VVVVYIRSDCALRLDNAPLHLTKENTGAFVVLTCRVCIRRDGGFVVL